MVLDCPAVISHSPFPRSGDDALLCMYARICCQSGSIDASQIQLARQDDDGAAAMSAHVRHHATDLCNNNIHPTPSYLQQIYNLRRRTPPSRRS